MRLRNYVNTGRLVTILIPCVLICNGTAHGEFTFGEPTLVGSVGGMDVAYAQISRDGLELYFAPEDEAQCADIWVIKRSSPAEPWGKPIKLDAPVNSEWQEISPSLSPNGLELYFANINYGCGLYPDGSGNDDLYVSRRATKDDPWGEPENLGPMVNSEYAEEQPCISADGLSLYFISERPGGQGYYDLYVSTRPTLEDPWEMAVNLGPPVNSGMEESTPFISSDGLSLFFSAGPRTLPFASQIYLSRRQDPASPWGRPQAYAPVQIPGRLEFFPSFSENDPTVYFSNGDDFYEGLFHLWQVKVAPIVDFSGDGKVDGRDVTVLANSWGSDDSVCDISPAPCGDWMVDLQDLVTLAEYIGQDIEDPTLVAHWGLDEADGAIAKESVGGQDGVLEGNPVWHPDGGMVGGALQLDGVDDCIETPLVLNPSEGPLGVLAWILGGAPGQVIVCQNSGDNWLMVRDDGVLATDLSSPGMNDVLVSDVSITDGNWHRVCLTWDGAVRSLYVDGVLVAEDDKASLAGQDAGLYIGARGPGNRFRAATFFSGLIDDIRIYNREVRP